MWRPWWFWYLMRWCVWLRLACPWSGTWDPLLAYRTYTHVFCVLLEWFGLFGLLGLLGLLAWRALSIALFFKTVGWPLFQHTDSLYRALVIARLSCSLLLSQQSVCLYTGRVTHALSLSLYFYRSLSSLCLWFAKDDQLFLSLSFCPSIWLSMI